MRHRATRRRVDVDVMTRATTRVVDARCARALTTRATTTRRVARRVSLDDVFARSVPSWSRDGADDDDDDDGRVMRGTYCDYVIDARDVMEVVGYRAGVVACAGGRWASAVIAATQGSAPAYVAEHASAMWAVGPMFAALTGLAFKEGMCYGKPEAAALFLGVPAACLMHLFGAPEEWQMWSTGGVLALLLVFAARKFTQEIADDVGDKSIFMFNALKDPAEKARWIANARRSGRAYVDESN